MVLPAMSRHKMDSSSDSELLVETVSFSQRFSKIYHMQAFGEFRFIGNKAKGQISKRFLTEHVKFSEKQIFLTPDTHTCVHVSGNKECSFFGKFNVLRFFCNTHFEIHPSALLPTVCSLFVWENICSIIEKWQLLLVWRKTNSSNDFFEEKML